MAVNFISAWKISRSDAVPLVRAYGKIAREVGAQSVSLHLQHAGGSPGVVYVVTTFANYEELGRAQEKLHNHDGHRTLNEQARTKGELVNRMITISEEI